MAFHVFVFLLVFFLILSLALLWRLCWFHLRPSSSRGGAKRSRLQHLLKPRCPDDCPACRLASTPSSAGGPAPADVASLARGQKLPGSTQAREHRGFRLSQPPVPVLRDHRCSRPRLGRRWQAWPCRANPDLWLSGLPHHLHCPTPHPFVSSETPFPCRVAVVLSALAEGLDPSAAERVSGFRQATITSLSHSCGLARTNPARALLLSSPAPAPAVRRTAHPAALRQTGALAVAGHRPLHQASSRAPSGSPHTTYGP
jgi:hypothetical protein